MEIDSWVDALSAIVAAAKIKNVDLAREAGLDPAGTHRYLRRQRTPSSRETVTSINSAVGRLTACDEVRAYLEAAWDLEHLDVNTTPTTAEARWAMLAESVSGLARYIEDLDDSIIEQIRTLPFKDLRMLLRVQDHSRRARLVSRFRGEVPDVPAAIEFICALKILGIDLVPQMRSREEWRAAYLDDEFALEVARAVASTGADVATRNECESRILRAFFKVRFAHWGREVRDHLDSFSDPAILELVKGDGELHEHLSA